MTQIGICKLCNKTKELRISHAIGDSIFKRIFRNNSGNAISISDTNDEVAYSSDSWAEHQQCSDCENLLNREYEKYSLGVLRAQDVKVSKRDIGIVFDEIDLHRLNMYFISLFWRAANSGHPAYKNTIISQPDNEYLREAILNNKSVSINKFSIKISRLTDRTPKDGFSQEELKGLIVSPFCRVYHETKINHISVCFTFEGFFIEVFMPGLDSGRREFIGVIYESRTSLIVPYLDIFDIKEIVAVMVDGYGKHAEGKSKVKAKKSIQRKV